MLSTMLSKRGNKSSGGTFVITVVLCQITVCFSQNYISNCSVVPIVTFDDAKVNVSSDIGIYKELVVNKIQDIKFTCVSKLPIDFHFKGQLPNLLTSSQTKRYTGTVNWDKPENFCYETTITVTTKIDATGEYTCSVVPTLGNGTTSFYLYSEGEVLHSILGAGTTIQVEITPKDTEVVIPCRVKHPNISSSLEKDGVLLNDTYYEHYDPQQGYVFKIRNPDDIVGHYKCSANNKKAWDNIKVNVAFVNGTSESPARSKETIPSITIIDGEAELKNQKIYLCTNNGTVKAFKYIKCFTPTECGIAENCLENDDLGTSKCYTSGEKCPFWLNTNGELPEDCQMISMRPNITSAGILRCENNYKTEQTARFYTDLNGKLVWENSDVRLADRLQIADEPYNWEQEKVWTEEKISMTCRASKFTFSVGFKWFFILKDGSIIDAIAKDLPNIETSNSYYSSTVEIKISNHNIKKVGCMAPVLNSADWDNVTINLSIQNSTFPVFSDPHNETVELELSDPNQKLNCTASGKPIEINWYKNNPVTGNEKIYIQNMPHIFSEDVLSVSFNPALHLPSDNSSLYICNASNHRGSVLKEYRVLIKDTKDDLLPSYAIAIIATSVLVIVLVAALVLRNCWRQDNYMRLMKTDEQNFLHGEKPAEVPEKKQKSDGGTQTDDLPQLPPYASLPYNHDKYEKLEGHLMLKQENIGEGQFGVVHRYILQDPKGDIDVAVKTIKDPTDIESFKLLLEEIKILQYVGYHPNVIKLVGAVTKDIRKLQALIIVEFCCFGNLKDYLVSHKGAFQSEIDERGRFRNNACAQPIGSYVQIEYAMRTSDLIQWSYEIACGMEYIAERRLVHRDLAARNVVLNSNKVAKITDFGLCKILQKDYYRFTISPGKKDPLLPLLWLAPEIFVGGKFSINSDIWAYGILLWEIFSLGEQPYPGKDYNQIKKCLEDGERMDRPQFCNADIHSVMLDCWKQTPEQRPPFSELKNTFADLQARLKECEAASAGQSEDENSEEEGSVDSDPNE